MRARVLAVLLPALLSFAAGCSLMLDTSKLDPPSEGATQAEVEAFSGAYYDAYFTKIQQVTGGTDDYVKYRSNLWERATFIERSVAAAAAGNRRYDATLATQCYAEIAAAADWPALADVVRNPLRACRGALVGALAPGDACTWDMECDNDHYCANLGFTCPGTCTARRADGATCTLNELYSECGPLSSCMLAGGVYSATGTCIHNHLDRGQSCFTGSMCRPGLFCSSSTSWACVDGAGQGESCATTPCALGLFCDSADSTCKTPANVGTGCGATNGGCQPGARCSESSGCVAQPKDGQNCGMIDAGENAACLVGACPTPSAASSTCPPIRDFKASCSTGDYCKMMGFSCNPGTGRCSQACN